MTLDVQELRIADLQPYYRNPRRGSVATIAQSLAVNGQYRAIVVNEGSKTGRAYEILAGNHTFYAAQSLDWDTIQAHVVDVDDDTAARIVVADNRTADLAENDDALLVDILTDLDVLDGTGYSDEDVAELQRLLDDASAEDWDDAFGALPEGEQEFFTMKFSLTAEQKERLDDALAHVLESAEPEGNRNAFALDRIVEAATNHWGT